MIEDISVHISEDGKTCKIEFPVFMRSVTHLKRALDLLLEDEENTEASLKEKFTDINYKPEYKIPTMIALRSILEKEIELNKLKLV